MYGIIRYKNAQRLRKAGLPTDGSGVYGHDFPLVYYLLLTDELMRLLTEDEVLENPVVDDSNV